MADRSPLDSPRWTHEPDRGPVAWGAAVLVVPAMPLLALLTLLAALAAGADDSHLVVLVTPVPWVLIGLAMLTGLRGRVVRGLGAGALAGGGTCLLLAALATNGGW